jgi:outer membrane lipoprotein-sorting protein
MKRLLIYIIIFFSFNSYALNKDLATKLEKYLNNTKTLTANFVQLNIDGTISEGSFFLKKPGNIRWQYDEPNKLQVLLKAKKLIYYDVDLDEVSYIDAKNTMLSFLSRPNINISEFKDIKKVELKNGLISMEVISQDKDVYQRQILYFNQEPVFIKKVEIYEEAEPQPTIVTFSNIKEGVALEMSIFELKRKPKFLKN